MDQPPIHLHKLPRGHGPPSHQLANWAPTFVRSIGDYDELGRALALSDVPSTSSAAPEQNAASFWRSLDVGKQAPAPAAVQSSRDRRSSPPPSATPASSIRHTMVPKSQWFVRRALSRKAGEAPPDAVVVPPLELPPPPKPGATPKGIAPPPHFHLKRDNKGYQVLQNIGWDGKTGLGGPPPADSASKQSQGGAKSEAIGDTDMLGGEGLAGDPNDDIDPDDDGAAESHGRLAPIPTYLKHDLRGIGHKPQRKYTALRPSTSSSTTQRKRVTHTEREIRAAARGKVVPNLNDDPEQRAKRERRRAMKAVKRDREERKAWQTIIGS